VNAGGSFLQDRERRLLEPENSELRLDQGSIHGADFQPALHQGRRISDTGYAARSESVPRHSSVGTVAASAALQPSLHRAGQGTHHDRSAVSAHSALVSSTGNAGAAPAVAIGGQQQPKPVSRWRQLLFGRFAGSANDGIASSKQRAGKGSNKPLQHPGVRRALGSTVIGSASPHSADHHRNSMSTPAGWATVEDPYAENKYADPTSHSDQRPVELYAPDMADDRVPHSESRAISMADSSSGVLGTGSSSTSSLQQPVPLFPRVRSSPAMSSPKRRPAALEVGSSLTARSAKRAKQKEAGDRAGKGPVANVVRIPSTGQLQKISEGRKEDGDSSSASPLSDIRTITVGVGGPLGGTHHHPASGFSTGTNSSGTTPKKPSPNRGTSVGGSPDTPTPTTADSAGDRASQAQPQPAQQKMQQRSPLRLAMSSANSTLPNPVLIMPPAAAQFDRLNSDDIPRVSSEGPSFGRGDSVHLAAVLNSNDSGSTTPSPMHAPASLATVSDGAGAPVSSDGHRSVQRASRPSVAASVHTNEPGTPGAVRFSSTSAAPSVGDQAVVPPLSPPDSVAVAAMKAAKTPFTVEVRRLHLHHHGHAFSEIPAELDADPPRTPTADPDQVGTDQTGTGPSFKINISPVDVTHHHQRPAPVSAPLLTSSSEPAYSFSNQLDRADNAAALSDPAHTSVSAAGVSLTLGASTAEHVLAAASGAGGLNTAGMPSIRENSIERDSSGTGTGDDDHDRDTNTSTSGLQAHLSVAPSPSVPRSPGHSPFGYADDSADVVSRQRMGSDSANASQQPVDADTPQRNGSSAHGRSQSGVAGASPGAVGSTYTRSRARSRSVSKTGSDRDRDSDGTLPSHGFLTSADMLSVPQPLMMIAPSHSEAVAELLSQSSSTARTAPHSDDSRGVHVAGSTTHLHPASAGPPVKLTRPVTTAADFITPALTPTSGRDSGHSESEEAALVATGTVVQGRHALTGASAASTLASSVRAISAVIDGTAPQRRSDISSPSSSATLGSATGSGGANVSQDHEQSVAQQSQQQRRGKIGSLQHKQSLVFLDLHLAKLCTWDFDMFHFAGTCSRPNAPSKPLAAVGYTLLHQFQLLNKLKLDPAVAFNCLDVIEVCLVRARISG